MTRFIISMPEEMLQQLDAAARREQRSRSELLREAVRRHLGSAVVAENAASYGSKSETRPKKKIGKKSARARLLERGIGTNGCPGLDRLFSRLNANVDMRKARAIGRKLSGLSRQIVDDRDERL